MLDQPKVASVKELIEFNDKHHTQAMPERKYAAAMHRARANIVQHIQTRTTFVLL